MKIKIRKILESSFEPHNFIIKIYADDIPIIIRMTKKELIEKLEIKKEAEKIIKYENEQ